MKAAKVREVTARARLLEADAAERDGDTTDKAGVMELLHAMLVPIRQKFLALPAEMAARCNPIDSTMARKALDEWVKNAMRLIQGDIKAECTRVNQEMAARERNGDDPATTVSSEEQAK